MINYTRENDDKLWYFWVLYPIFRQPTCLPQLYPDYTSIHPSVYPELSPLTLAATHWVSLQRWWLFRTIPGRGMVAD